MGRAAACASSAARANASSEAGWPVSASSASGARMTVGATAPRQICASRIVSPSGARVSRMPTPTAAMSMVFRGVWR